LNDPFITLELIYISNSLVYLIKDRAVRLDTSRVLAREDVIDVVLELLAADCADHVVCTRPGLLDAGWVLVILVFVPAHVGDIVFVFVIQELSVLLGKLTLLLELED